MVYVAIFVYGNILGAVIQGGWCPRSCSVGLVIGVMESDLWSNYADVLEALACALRGDFERSKFVGNWEDNLVDVR